MPLAATVPNSASPAPPSTGSGSAATTAPTFGNRPEHHQDHAADRDDEPALDAGERHQADVLRERADREAVEQAAGDGGGQACRPAARWPRSCRSAGRPTTTPMASRSAVVSVMITSITMTIETIAADLEGRRAEVERGGDREALRLGRPG